MIYRFGLFEFDAAAGELTSEGRRVPLEPQPARALALLLSRAGEVVTREDLRAYLWGAETHVDVDRGLGYCIGELRGALRDRADNPRFIQTLPRRGYRVIAPVTVSAGPLKNGDSHDVSVRHAVETAVPPPRTARWIAAALILGTIVAAGVWVNARRGQPPARPIVAVAVFDNETGESRHDRLVQGLSDVVVDRLTAIGPDRVGVVGNMPELAADARGSEPLRHRERNTRVVHHPRTIAVEGRRPLTAASAHPSGRRDARVGTADRAARGRCARRSGRRNGASDRRGGSTARARILRIRVNSFADRSLRPVRILDGVDGRHVRKRGRESFPS